MDDTRNAKPRRVGGTIGLVAAGAIAGGVLVTTLSASATTNDTTTNDTTTNDTTTGAGRMMADGGRHAPMSQSSTPLRGDEKQVSDSTASKLRAKALAAVSGGKVYRIETDAGDGSYEAHMTRSDGTPVTVKFDKSLNVMRVEEGMGMGDPGPVGAPHGMGGPPGPQLQPGTTTG